MVNCKYKKKKKNYVPSLLGLCKYFSVTHLFQYGMGGRQNKYEFIYIYIYV